VSVAGFREPLDLSDIMAPFEKVLGQPAKGVRLAPDEESINSPILIGENPVCSSSKVLMTSGPQFCWDANGYYRELGVHWRASKGDLKRAYEDSNGQDSPRLTYIFKQLLNKETRALYDSTPLGEIFFDDYVAEMLKERAVKEAARRSRTQYVSPEDVLSEWGFTLDDNDAADLIADGETSDFPAEGLDRETLRGQDDPSQVEYQGKWLYGYYLWRTLCGDTDRLAVWQQLLVDALEGQQAKASFAVGFVGKQPHPYVLGLVSGGVYVVYLNDSVTPDSEVASRAASALLREMKESRQLNRSEPMRQDNQMTTATKPKFGKGGKAAAAADEAVRAASGKHFRRTPYLSIEDGDYQIVRYLTDSPDWTYVKQHPGAPTKNGPADYKGTWPTSMPAICRHDDAFEGIYDDCYICDAELIDNWGKKCTPKVRVWALAVLREEVVGTQEMADAGQIPAEKVGFLVGCRDVYREVDETNEKGEATGKKVKELAIVLVNFAVSNFFDGLNSAYGTYGTVCDRDFKVERKGTSKDTEYFNIGLDPTPNLKPGTEKWQKYLDAIEEQKVDVEEIISDRASDDYFARFFDPNKTVASKSDSDSAPTTQQAAAPSNDVDPERLQALRDRVKGAAPQEAAPVAAAAAVDFD
jgi:hypothetical protein